MFHEIGNEQVEPAVGPYDKNGVQLPTIDKHTGAYRPGSRAINYRSEPFMNRLDKDADESQAYGSYTFGDPATPTPRAYLSDPTKFRIVHAGTEMFHVFHMHGGGIRWRFNPLADKTFDYQKTGLDKYPKAQLLASDTPRLPGHWPRRVLQPRDRGRRRWRTAGRRRVPLPLPHRLALRLRHVGLLARLRHQSAGLRGLAGSRAASRTRLHRQA